MHKAATACAIAVLLAAPVAAWAYPEGAPWGAANPQAQESCASCHFDSDAVDQSTAIAIAGLPERPAAGDTYPLELTVDVPLSAVAGFQIVALAKRDADAGRFVFSDATLEAAGTAIRSTSVRRKQPAAWSFQWQAPVDLHLPILLLVAATAGNDDGSPLGDVVHFRSFELGAKTD